MQLSKRRHAEEIPTSSMADIAFLLLIFFMVTTVFSVTKGMGITQDLKPLPSGGAPERAVHLSIQADNGLLLNGQPFDEQRR